MTWKRRNPTPEFVSAPEPVEILLGLVAADLILQRVDALLALQAFELLVLAERIGLALNAIDLLLGLQALELLIAPELVDSALGFDRLCLRLSLGCLPHLAEFALQLLNFLFAPEVFDLFLAL